MSAQRKTPHAPAWRRFLHALGIFMRFPRELCVRLRPRFFAILGGAFLLLLATMAGVVKYSESPSFCNSCHIMEPYYKAWKTSKHNQVACVECHYPPGSKKTLLWKKFQAVSQVVKYVTRTYSSKPFAEIEDASCLRSGCHSTQLLEGRMISKRGIKFDHRPHMIGVRRGRRLRCVSCHSQIVVGRHVEVTYDTCFLCHFKGMGEGRDLKPLGGCLGCHQLPTRSFKLGGMTYNHRDFVEKRGISCQNCHLDVVQGKGEAKQDRCFTCHNQPEKLARFRDIPFIHDNHVTKHNVACFHCHQEIRHGLAAGKESQMSKFGEESEPAAKPPQGHPPALSFDCAYCHREMHAGQLEMYSGKVSGLGLDDMPSPMYLADVDCIGCHYEDGAAGGAAEFSGRTHKASAEACVNCHGADFKGIWERTRDMLSAGLRGLKGKLGKARASLAASGLSGKRLRSLEAELAKAERWYSFVRVSKGEHNIYLAADILRKADRTAQAVGDGLGAELPDLSADPLYSGAYCAVMCHPQAGVRVPAEKVKTWRGIMPHKAHYEMTGGCVQCHVLGPHKKAPLRRGVRAVCGKCHPS